MVELEKKIIWCLLLFNTVILHNNTILYYTVLAEHVRHGVLAPPIGCNNNYYHCDVHNIVKRVCRGGK